MPAQRLYAAYPELAPKTTPRGSAFRVGLRGRVPYNPP